MSYSVKVLDKSDRKAQIDGQIKPNSPRKKFNYREQDEQLPVIRVSLDLPIYRMGNGRTSVEQLDYIRESSKPATYFLNGEEDEDIQQVQHDILIRMSKDQKAPIYDELEFKRSQTQELIVTAHGVVVNGNRRLAAMRELYEADPYQYKEFAYVDVMVLPEDATAVDIETIESELQMVRETKLEYGWVERLLKLRYHKETLSLPMTKIRKMYRFKKDDEINRELLKLDLIDEYLDRYIGKPGCYRLVEHNEQVFRELQQVIAKRDGELADLARLVAFPIIKEAPNLKTRAYALRHGFGKYLEDVIDSLSAQYGSEDQEVHELDFGEDDPLAGIEPNGNKYSALKKVLADPESSGKIAGSIKIIVSDLDDEAEEEGMKMAGLKLAEDVNTKLYSIDLSTSDYHTYAQIRSQLNSVVGRAKSLIADIDKILGPAKE